MVRVTAPAPVGPVELRATREAIGWTQAEMAAALMMNRERYAWQEAGERPRPGGARPVRPLAGHRARLVRLLARDERMRGNARALVRALLQA